jgi:hypothetical protein
VIFLSGLPRHAGEKLFKPDQDEKLGMLRIKISSDAEVGQSVFLTVSRQITSLTI